MVDADGDLGLSSGSLSVLLEQYKLMQCELWHWHFIAISCDHISSTIWRLMSKFFISEHSLQSWSLSSELCIHWPKLHLLLSALRGWNVHDLLHNYDSELQRWVGVSDEHYIILQHGCMSDADQLLIEQLDEQLMVCFSI